MTPEAGGTNVLVLGDELAEAKEGFCHELFTPSTVTPGDISVVRVTYTDTVDRLLAEWETHVGGTPRRLHVLEVHDARGAFEGGASTPGFATRSDANPNDLTGLAMRIRDALEDAYEEDATLVFCFDSLTHLLQYFEVEPAYKFLHMLTGQLRKGDAVAHFHVDPDACDDQTVNRLRSLFDEQVQLPQPSQH